MTQPSNISKRVTEAYSLHRPPHRFEAGDADGERCRICNGYRGAHLETDFVAGKGVQPMVCMNEHVQYPRPKL